MPGHSQESPRAIFLNTDRRDRGAQEARSCVTLCTDPAAQATGHPPESHLVSPVFPAQVSRFCREMTGSKNYALPNASWGPDMLSLYHEFLEKTKTEGWVRLPSFRSNRDHIQGFKLPLESSANSGKAWPESGPWHAHAPAHWNQFSQPLFRQPGTYREGTHKLSASSQPEVLSGKSTPHAAAPGTWMRKASSQPPPPTPLLLGDESMPKQLPLLPAQSAPSGELLTQPSTHWPPHQGCLPYCQALSQVPLRTPQRSEDSPLPTGDLPHHPCSARPRDS